METTSPGELDALLKSIPDVLDRLTRTERIILYMLDETRRERAGRNVPMVMLYGRVLDGVFSRFYRGN